MAKNILIVEDERVIAMSLKAVAKRMGYHVVGIVSSGEEAIKAIEEYKIDLLIMDIILAGALDGIETAGIIKSKMNIPLIFISANSSPLIQKRARNIEHQAFLIKPFSEKEIAINIELAIYKGKSEKALSDARDLLHQLNHELEKKVALRTESLKELNQQLIEKQQLITSINNSVPIIIFIYNLIDKKITFINDQIFTVLGYSAEEILHPSFQNDPANHFDFIGLAVSKNINEIMVKEGFFDQLLHVRHKQKKNGAKWLLIRFAEFKTDALGNKIEIVGSATDVTEQKQNERKLSVMMRLNQMQVKRTEKIRALSLLEGQEEERRRISRDMHDGVGQMLMAIKLNLDNCGPENKWCAPVRELIRETIMEVRRISNALAPPGLYDFGLYSVTKQLLEQLSNSAEMKIHFDSNIQNIRFPPLIETTLYRIIQESVNNASKHSHAKNLKLNLNQENNSLELVIFDDGIGTSISTIDLDENKSGGHGLKNIKLRANLIGAKLNIISEPGKGFTIQLHIPLKNIPYDKNNNCG